MALQRRESAICNQPDLGRGHCCHDALHQGTDIFVLLYSKSRVQMCVASLIVPSARCGCPPRPPSSSAPTPTADLRMPHSLAQVRFMLYTVCARGGITLC